MNLTPDYQGEFEVHLTVRVVGEPQRFCAWCEAEGFKSVRIVLARGVYAEQPMATWRRRATTLPQVLAEATDSAKRLESAGFKVVRLKIEADPSNDEVPETNSAARVLPPSNYFEHHIKLLRPAGSSCERLLLACANHGAHISRNAWREPLAGLEERFVTMRASGVGRPESFLRLRRLLAAVNAAEEQVLHVESEYTVYDSNLEMDAGWLQGDNS